MTTNSDLYNTLRTSQYPWVRYNTLRHLDKKPGSNPQVKTTQAQLLSHPLITTEMETCRKWPYPALKSHKTAAHPLHHLRLLADLGVSVKEPGVAAIVKSILSHQNEAGALESVVTLPRIWGGSDAPQWLWMLCDAPVVLHACLALGMPETDRRIGRALDHLRQTIDSRGWVCSSSLEKLSGPGRKKDPCPYATLLTLRAFALSPSLNRHSLCKTGTDILLSHWENRTRFKLRMFGIGTEFSKLKFPFVFYDILHVADVLSYFPWTWRDHRFREMLEVILSKRNDDGLFTPESVWTAFKEFDFGQKKEPSPMLTFIIEAILQREYRQ